MLNCWRAVKVENYREQERVGDRNCRSNQVTKSEISEKSHNASEKSLVLVLHVSLFTVWQLRMSVTPRRDIRSCQTDLSGMLLPDTV